MSGNASAESFTVALTGGIASGKSVVSREFERLGVNVFDADVLARELVSPGSPMLEEIAAAFGPAILDDDGELRRMELRRIVFHDGAARLRLEAILHSPIAERLRASCLAIHRPRYAVAVIPLLVEKGGYSWVDRVLVVDAPPAIQRQRLTARDAGSADLVDRILATQATRAARLALADDVIRNTGDVGALAEAVRLLDAKYKAMAAI